ncbi:MAG: DNA polymerase Y family protein [Alphaproteobacteria bacterium]|nr:MAG: DNA polymerase Y family protein [Alphaproteobacteria bacterium]
MATRQRPRRRIAALYFPWLATDRVARKIADYRTRPLALACKSGNRVMVSAVNPAAEDMGLMPGLALADARARVPNLAVRPHDPVADHALLDRLARWAILYTPYVAVADATTLFLDLTGVAHLFGGEEALLKDVIYRLRHRGLTTTAGVADTPGAAWAVARFATSDRNIAVLPPFESPDHARAALAPLPVAGLRLSPDITDALSAFGLHRVGDLYPLTRADLTHRFGDSLLLRLDQATGVEDEPLSPRLPVPAWRERMTFADPIGAPEDIRMATEKLALALAHRLESAAHGARRITLSAYRCDGRIIGVEIGLSRPNRDPAVWMRLFAPKLETLDPGFGIDALVLAAPQTESLALTQTGWTNDPNHDTGDLAALVDRLGNRFGFDRIARVAPRQSWLPERAVIKTNPLGMHAPAEMWPTDRPRPLRLLPHPEPVTAMAPVPDDPPVLFHWRHRPHRVRRADGPERITPEWWRRPNRDFPFVAPHEVRDYYAIEDDTGARFWLFRAGLYRPDQDPRWYLHGFFG